MTRWPLAALLLLIGCDAAPFVPPTLTECATPDYPAWQTSDYVLPYPPGRAYLVLQGHCGSFSHSSGSPIAYAVDFRMPIGEVVAAMPGGTVSEVEESFVDFDNTRGHENAVVVDHGDGTVGVYLPTAWPPRSAMSSHRATRWDSAATPASAPSRTSTSTSGAAARTPAPRSRPPSATRPPTRAGSSEGSATSRRPRNPLALAA